MRWRMAYHRMADRAWLIRHVRSRMAYDRSIGSSGLAQRTLFRRTPRSMAMLNRMKTLVLLFFLSKSWYRAWRGGQTPSECGRCPQAGSTARRLRPTDRSPRVFTSKLFALLRTIPIFASDWARYFFASKTGPRRSRTIEAASTQAGNGQGSVLPCRGLLHGGRRGSRPPNDRHGGQPCARMMHRSARSTESTWSSTLRHARRDLSWMEKARASRFQLPRVDFDIARTQFDLTDYQSAHSRFRGGVEKEIPAMVRLHFISRSRGQTWATGRKPETSIPTRLTHRYEKGTAFYGLGQSAGGIRSVRSMLYRLSNARSFWQPSLIKAHFQLGKSLPATWDEPRKRRMRAGSSRR